MRIVYHHFSTIDSTNNWAKRNCHLFATDVMTLVTADGQTAGRGRFNRSWISPERQNIYATYNLFIDKKRLDIGNLPQLLALSAVEVVRGLGLQAAIRWPNDLVIDGKKIGGILCETVDCGDALCVIIGIGININMPLEVAQQIDRPATSLLIEGGKSWEIEPILGLVTTTFVAHLQRFLEKGFQPFIEPFRQAIGFTVGQRVRFSDFVNTPSEGRYHSINDDGSLNLLLDDGVLKRCISGEFISNETA